MSEASVRGGSLGIDEQEAVGVEALTDEILPALIARLRASRLGELEVRSDGWRVRLRREARLPRSVSRSQPGDAGVETTEDDETVVARSPAVGYFSPGPLLVIGRSVEAGDQLGGVDVLGIAQEVTAPSSGIVSAVLAEVGQAVEYGQALAEIDTLSDVPWPADRVGVRDAAPAETGDAPAVVTDER